LIIEIGHFALVLALAVAVLQTVLPAWGAHVRDSRLMAVGSPAAVMQVVLVAGAFAALTYAYVVSDFSVANVYLNSHSAKPLLYRISGVWGNHEGSMLLWVLMLTAFGAAVAVFGQRLPQTLRANVLAVQGSVAVAFMLFILLTSNPLHPTRAGAGVRGLA
jgi:Cytochrome c biogenesis factor